MLRKAFSLILVAGLLTVAPARALAQATGGAVTGTVIDTQGGAVAGAAVTLTDKQKGRAFNTQTTDAGSFNFPNVPVGDYTLKVQHAGFGEATSEARVALNTTTTADVTLQPGAVSESVTVSAASEAVVQTDSSQLTNSFETRQVVNLPTFGDQNALALLAPNVAERSAGVVGSGGSVGGTRTRGNSFNIDGVDNNDTSTTGVVVDVIQDAVEQFSLVSNNFNAEFGNVAGGLFNTVTKSGTNEFHGSGFFYQQSEKFNAATTGEERQLRSGALTGLPRLRDRRLGATFGGPVIKNKLFFFGAYEHRENATAGTVGGYLAPTAAGLDLLASRPGASPFVVNFLRQNLPLAPAADQTLEVLGAAIPFGPVSVLAPTGLTNHQFQLNVDHSPSANDQFRYRFNFQRTRAEQAGGLTGVAAPPRFNNLASFDARLFSATWVRAISPSLVNDLRLAYRRAPLNFPLKDSALEGFPNIFEVETGIDLGPNGNLPQGTPVDNNYQVADSLSYARGAHNFKFGGDFRRLIATNAFLPRARGEYIYGSFEELITDAAPSLSNLRGAGTQFFVGNQSFFGAFAQDDWKVTPDLTLNLGLRYEYATLPRDSRLQALNSISNVPGVIEFGVPETDRNNFAPRVGVAYAPSGGGSRLSRLLFGERGESSLRANFGVSYYVNFQNLPLLALPPQAQTELNLLSASTVFGFDPRRPFLENGGLPGTLPPVPDAARARALTQSRIPDQINPYSLSWTLSYQRQLTPSTGLELRYLSTRGRNLPVQVRLNAGVVPSLALPTFFARPSQAELDALPVSLEQLLSTILDAEGNLLNLKLQPYGFLGSLTEHSPVGSSQYDAGSASLTRRFSRNFGFTAAYTWSKTIDDSTNELNSSAVNPRRAQDAFDLRAERGLSALDVPHRFVTSFNVNVPYVLKYDNRVLRELFGGFELHGVFQAQSGQPITPLSNTIFGLDSNLNFDAAGDRTIVNQGGRPGAGSSVTPLLNSNEEVVGYLVNDPTAQYIQAGPGARSNAGRNTLRSPGFNRTDLTVLKRIGLGERLRLELGAEVFDLFNQRPATLNNDLVGLFFSPAFARVGTTAFNNYDAGNYVGRRIQMRAKLIF